MTCEVCGSPTTTNRQRYCDRCRPHPPAQRGERNGFHKLTEGDVLAIREEHGTDEDIARRFRCSRSNINLICRFRAWAHL